MSDPASKIRNRENNVTTARTLKPASSTANMFPDPYIRTDKENSYNDLALSGREPSAHATLEMVHQMQNREKSYDNCRCLCRSDQNGKR